MLYLYTLEITGDRDHVTPPRAGSAMRDDPGTSEPAHRTLATHQPYPSVEYPTRRPMHFVIVVHMPDEIDSSYDGSMRFRYNDLDRIRIAQSVAPPCDCEARRPEAGGHELQAIVSYGGSHSSRCPAAALRTHHTGRFHPLRPTGT